jgi:hypothetical protein
MELLETVDHRARLSLHHLTPPFCFPLLRVARDPGLVAAEAGKVI